MHHGAAPRDYGTTAYVRRTEHFVAGRGAGTDAVLRVPRGLRAAPTGHARAARRTRSSRTRECRARLRSTSATCRRCRASYATCHASVPRAGGDRRALPASASARCRRSTAASAALVRTLRVTGQLDNTYIVFTSDNGFHLGQHRLPAGKQTAYDTDIHVPLLIRGPGSRRLHVGQLTGNVDLAETFEAMAGVRAPAFADGRSLLPLAHGHSSSARHWRTAYLVEHRNERGMSRTVAPRRRSLPLEPPDPDQGGVVHRSPHGSHRGRARPSARATRHTRPAASPADPRLRRGPYAALPLRRVCQRRP